MGSWREDEQVAAEFSECGNYRYWLSVEFRDLVERPKGTLAVIGLNPSKADLNRDDQTVRKCVNWAKWQQYHSLLMLNCFAFRATKPQEMKATEDPFGGQTAWKVVHLLRGCRVVCAWGGDGKHLGRAAELLTAFRPENNFGVLDEYLWCFGKNKDGSPLHPCYARLPDELIRYA